MPFAGRKWCGSLPASPLPALRQSPMMYGPPVAPMPQAMEPTHVLCFAVRQRSCSGQHLEPAPDHRELPKAEGKEAIGKEKPKGKGSQATLHMVTAPVPNRWMT